MKSKNLKLQVLLIFLGLTTLLLSACGSTNQSTSDDIIRIGVVNQFAFFEPALDGFKEQMAESGFIEGEDIMYIYNGELGFAGDVIQQEIQNLLDQDVDLFFTLGSAPTAAVNAILEENDLQAVFASVTNPEKQNLVANLTNPGGRITGINIGGPILRKSLEWFLTVSPNTERVHLFYLDGERLATPQLDDFQITSDQLSVELVLHALTSVEEATEIIEGLDPERDAIFSTASEIDTSYVGLGAQNNIPIGSSTIVTGSIITGPSIDYPGMGRQAAFLAQQILRGADAGTLPVEPAQYTLLLNLEYGESLGLNIPNSVVQQAGEVVNIQLVAEATEEATEEAGDS